MVTFVVLRIAAVILLVAANAFFVAAEFALVSIRETRLEQLLAARRMGARTVQKLHQKLDEFIAAVQFGVTMASLALGWIGEAAMARLIEPLFRRLPHAHIYAHAVSITVAFLLITYMHVILGEIVPKSLALQRTETVALAVAGPIDFFMTLAAPLLAIMTTSARIVLRAFGTKQVREGGVHSSEELKLIVSASHRTGVLEAPQEQMIQRALELENIVVREVMVPRPDIFSLPGDMPLDEAFQRVAEETHSRVPVYDSQRGPEHIIGVLYARDLLRWLSYRGGTPGAGHPHAWSSELKVRHLMREVLVVPETKPLTDLLLEFKQKKRHLAVVVDEFGSTASSPWKTSWNNLSERSKTNTRLPSPSSPRGKPRWCSMAAPTSAISSRSTISPCPVMRDSRPSPDSCWRSCNASRSPATISSSKAAATLSSASTTSASIPSRSKPCNRNLPHQLQPCHPERPLCYSPTEVI